LALDAAGNLIFSDYNYLRKLGTNGLLTPLAGTGYGDYSGDGGPATQASLDGPSGVAADPAGDVFIADTGNQRIRRVDTNGVITTVAGNGTNGYSGDGGAATNARFYNPSGVAVDAAGDLFIADTLNHRIRKVDINGIITTVAGSGVSGYAGDGGAATNAKLAQPNGLAMDGVGNLFIADTYNHRIRKVSPFASLPTLTLNNLATNNAGDYQVIVTGASGSVTSSVVTLTVVLWQPAIASATLNADGSLTLNLASPPGATNRLWAATNLTPPVLWQALATNLTGGNWQFTDAGAASCQTRFYRISVP
jgi:sugar lactone lactonase YvrE